MAEQFKKFLDKETYILFVEDGLKWRFSSNNLALQEWINKAKNKTVKRDAIKFVVNAAKNYMKNPQQALASKPKPKNQTGTNTNVNDIKTWQTDPIGSLNLYCQRNALTFPQYEVVAVKQGNGTQTVTVKMTTPQGKEIQESAASAKDAKRLLAFAYARNDLKVAVLQNQKQQDEVLSESKPVSSAAQAVQTFLDKASSEDKKIMIDLMEEYRSHFGRKRTLKEFAEYTIGEYRQGIGGAVAFYDDREGYTQPIWQDTQGRTDIEVLRAMVDDVKNAKILEAQERVAQVREKQTAVRTQEDTAAFLLVRQENIDENHRSYILREGNGTQYKLNVEYGDVKEKEHHIFKKMVVDRNDLRWKSVANQYADSPVEKVTKPMRTLKVGYEALNFDERFEFSSSVEPDAAKNNPQSVDRVFAHNFKMYLAKAWKNTDRAAKLWRMLVSVKEPIIQSEQRKNVLTKPTNQR